LAIALVSARLDRGPPGPEFEIFRAQNRGFGEHRAQRQKDLVSLGADETETDQSIDGFVQITDRAAEDGSDLGEASARLGKQGAIELDLEIGEVPGIPHNVHCS
jgi:hypothetical protein